MPKSEKIPKREMKIFYRTEDMLYPQFKYTLDKEKGEVACMATFVPTFEPKHPQDGIITSETPE